MLQVAIKGWLILFSTLISYAKIKNKNITRKCKTKDYIYAAFPDTMFMFNSALLIFRSFMPKIHNHQNANFQQQL